MNEYIYSYKNSLTSIEKNEITLFLNNCANEDNYLYDLQYEDDISEIPSFYFCYDSNNLIGILTVCGDFSDTLYLYSIVSKQYRNNHIFSTLYNIFFDFISSVKHPYKNIEFHLPCDNSIFFQPAITILSKNNFYLSHKEYFLTFNLAKKPNKKSFNLHSTHCTKDLELIFDNNKNEFTLWFEDEYIGGCMIYFSENKDNSYATIYDYQLMENYRGIGLGKYALYLILKELHYMQYKKVILHVSGKNKIAHNLYLSCGFNIKSSIKIFIKEL